MASDTEEYGESRKYLPGVCGTVMVAEYCVDFEVDFVAVKETAELLNMAVGVPFLVGMRETVSLVPGYVFTS